MDGVSNIKFILCSVIGAVGGAIMSLFGGWTEDMLTLVIFMAADFVMGLTAAALFQSSDKSKTGALESRACWKGLARKGGTLLFVLIAHRLDIALGSDYIKTATTIGFIVNEAISVVEKAGLMGIPMPSAVRKAIDVLKNRSDRDGEQK